ncbi:MAG: LysR substrate-binding domain-containing protein, partial [Ruthenibacterium sp.]
MVARIERFLRAQPQATFSLTVDNTQGLLQALEEGRLDFALVEGYFDRSRYSARLYRQEAFFGICAPGHRLAGRTVPLEELERERLILREPGSGTRAILEEGLRRQNRALGSFPGVVAISDFTVIKTLVARGLGVSFLYA